MRTLDQTTLVQETNPDFPFGSTIQNETNTQDGTGVVRELYGDIVQNIYKLMKLAEIEPTGDEDSDATQYQIIEALKKFSNDMNDVEQVLSLTGVKWMVPFKLSILPNKYVYFSRAAADYVTGVSYKFKGSGVTEYDFTSPTGFNESDELMIVIDTAGVRAYSLSALTAAPSEVLLGLGIPVAFNDTNVLRYQEEGNLMSDIPSVEYIESILRTESGEGTLLVNDILILQGYILCFCYITANTYVFWQFPINDIGSPSEVTITGVTFGTTDDFMPYVYTDGTTVFVTNNCNNSANDLQFQALEYDGAGAELSLTTGFSVDASFIKTSNAVVGEELITFYDGILTKFGLPGVATILGEYNGVNGNLFAFNGSFYFSNGDVAKKWNL